MPLNRARRKLIEELLSVGRLIDPTSHVDEHELNDTEFTLDASVPPIVEEPTIETILVDSPNPEDAIDRPYDNIDMFAAPQETCSAIPEDHTDLEILPVPESDKIQRSSVEPETPAILESETPVNKEASHDLVPAEELARELVDLIGNRINERTGEQLDDAMCDDLKQVVVKHIESWLEHD